jgi:putative FmdB family regulatory protein
MPTYEYECSSCRHAWDLFQSIKADPERKCPKCGRMTARRKIGIGAAILSGGRSADAQEAPAAGTTGTTPATVGTQAASGDSKPAPSDAKTTPAPTQSSTPTPTPASTPASERGTLNSTHPARDGRGAGNLRIRHAIHVQARRSRACEAFRETGDGHAPRRSVAMTHG